MADKRRREGSVLDVSRYSKAYVSGPITGFPLAERRRVFARATRKYQRSLGIVVVNPLSLPHNDFKNRHKGWEFFLRQDIKALMECDHIILLKGWERSRGAQLELGIANRLGMAVVVDDDAVPPKDGVEFEGGVLGLPPMEQKSDEKNPKDLVGMNKVPLQLVPPIALAQEALVMGHGAAKYGPWNWRAKKIQVSEYVAAMKRHIDQYWDGEDLDVGTPEKPGSGHPHLAHLRATSGVLMDAIGSGMVVDDRPKNGGAAAKLIREYTK